MSRFAQLHLLTAYPPANLNRDDLGRPKTAMMGGAQRLRISSQSLKRAWRTSELFQQSLRGHLGVRTKEMGREIYKDLVNKGVKEKDAKAWAIAIAGIFGKAKKEDKKNKDPLHMLDIEQLAHFSPEEREAISALCDKLAERGDGPENDELNLLRKHHSAADIALFGRMLASDPGYNTEAAAQVAHAISVHKVTVEDDFFTAVDDLNNGEEDVGAGHMGETEFAAGLFYQYICVDRELLKNNLGGDEALADKALAALTESAATIAPTGKQNSFASRARASYILAEVGDQQPRSLSVAFLKPVNGADILEQSVTSLDKTVSAMDKAYGACADKREVMNLVSGKGGLREIIDCITE
ncbi:CRISPR-associated protein, Cse4 family [Thiohalobacter thiocyanaticus]|uniref:CRISPR-associated protein, Cse4 family n=1 Tax=Thiohalobacter thiocyanaticus TaxID=585455 RepID=A0A1Z4VUP4_9GAMM|nr:type I-E CRISPR-associated protein Cas7/Cse4/CasC [Thiohalobacter thiocyanaticus]BAZ95175.1 CRISPR-associated protein, Cse4 family [Thiohalobacter thiocyanaticus]